VSYQPTIIRPSTVVTNVNPTFKPTVVTSIQETPKQTQPPVSFQVTPMKGHVRKSLDPIELKLDSRYSGVDVTIMNMLKRRISEIVLETLTTMNCENLGNELQSRFNQILTGSISVFQNPNLKNGQRHLSRLRIILKESLDELENGKGFLRRKVDSGELLTKLCVEVNQLKSIISTTIEEMEVIKQDLNRFWSQLTELCDTLSSEMLVVEVLMDLVSEDHKNVLIRRGLSIGQTLAQIKTQYSIYDGMLQSTTELMQSMHDAVYIQLPAMLQCIMSNSTGDMTDTQKYVISESMKSIIEIITMKEMKWH